MSRVADVQRALTRVCLSREPSPADVAAIGNDRAVLYRDLVRSRLRDLLSIALPRTERVLGKDAITTLFVAYLDESPPTSRYFREVVPAFLAFSMPRLASIGAPDHARDVAVLEGTQWELGWRTAEDPGSIAPLDLALVPVASPTLRLLTLGHAVSLEPGGAVIAEPLRAVTTHVSVHRRRDHRVETRALDPTGARLLARWMRGDASAIDGVREVLAEEGRAADEAFVGKMSALLSALIDSGALLGSRAA